MEKHSTKFSFLSLTGVDPKSVICAFFKQGQCSKGAKCKFSHDLNVSRKGEKINVYEDVRDDGELVSYEPCREKTCLQGFPTRSDTN